MRRVFELAAVITFGILAPAWAQAPAHPLDALTQAEHWTVYDVIRDSGRMDAETRYAGVSLHEPPKAEVLAWKPGCPSGARHRPSS